MGSQKNILSRIKNNPLVVGAIIFAIIFIILIIVTLINIFKPNRFGPGTKIENLTSEYKDLPKTQQDMIENYLYNTLSENLPEGETIPESGAVIREGTADYTNDTISYDAKIYYGSFIVDIPSVERSYRVQFEWSPEENNRNLSGHPVVITCLPESLQIYEPQPCSNMVELDSSWENAFQLDYTLGSRTSAEVRETIGDYLINEVGQQKYYSITIDETTLKRNKTQPDLTYEFKSTLNDEYDFNTIVRIDQFYGSEYIAILVKFGDKSNGFILTKKEELQKSLAEWLVNVSGEEQLDVSFSTLEI